MDTYTYVGTYLQDTTKQETMVQYKGSRLSSFFSTANGLVGFERLLLLYFYLYEYCYLMGTYTPEFTVPILVPDCVHTTTSDWTSQLFSGTLSQCQRVVQRNYFLSGKNNWRNQDNNNAIITYNYVDFF